MLMRLRAGSLSPRRGIALASVLGIAAVLMIKANVLILTVHRNRPFQVARADQVKATYLARGAIEYILLKIRSLPNEFYDAYKDLRGKVRDEGSEELGMKKADLYQEFIKDFVVSDLEGNTINFPLNGSSPPTPLDDDLGRVTFVKFSIIGETPILNTSASEEYYEQDIMKIVVEARVGGTIREITQIINLSRGVELH